MSLPAVGLPWRHLAALGAVGCLCACSAPIVLAWLVLPNLLAVVFLGVPAGVVLTLAETILLVASQRRERQHWSVIGLLWSLLPVAALLARTFQQVFRWSVDYSRQC